MPAPVEQTHEYDRGSRATEELRKYRHASEELAEGYEAVLAELVDERWGRWLRCARFKPDRELSVLPPRFVFMRCGAAQQDRQNSGRPSGCYCLSRRSFGFGDCRTQHGRQANAQPLHPQLKCGTLQSETRSRSIRSTDYAVRRFKSAQDLSPFRLV
jgi:hypothetical protein